MICQTTGIGGVVVRVVASHPSCPLCFEWPLQLPFNSRVLFQSVSVVSKFAK